LLLIDNSLCHTFSGYLGGFFNANPATR
jgi:hypothetical protein